MADVIIKGMEMPSSCKSCKLNNDTVCALINGCVYDETDGSTRRPDCPLRPAPEWISVEERLPETNGRYIVAYEDATTILEFFNGKWFFAWRDRSGRQYEQTGTIIAWMPLPKPPGGADNG